MSTSKIEPGTSRLEEKRCQVRGEDGVEIERTKTNAPAAFSPVARVPPTSFPTAAPVSFTEVAASTEVRESSEKISGAQGGGGGKGRRERTDLVLDREPRRGEGQRSSARSKGGGEGRDSRDGRSEHGVFLEGSWWVEEREGRSWEKEREKGRDRADASWK